MRFTGDAPAGPDDSTKRKRPQRRKRAARVPSLAQLLTSAVELDPDKVAVTSSGRSLSYRQLDERSSQLARVLIARGAAPDTVVALSLRRSLESVVAIWAIAKSGAAYVPLDPKLPAERLAHMAQDSEAVLGLVLAEHADLVPDGPAWAIFDSPDFQVELDLASSSPIIDDDRLKTLVPQHPAYVIYTSGSTGRPKGVVVTHTGLGALIDTAADLYGLDQSTRFLHICALSFDPSVLEMLGAFNRGGTLVVAPPDIIGGDDLSELLTAESVSHTIITPGVLGTVDPAGQGTLRVVSVGGDATTPDLLARWAPGRTYFNGYGPTETTIISCYATLGAEGPVTIGNPVPGTTAVVLDGRLQPVPAGTPGELYLAGPALARGYLGKHAMTSERFVADPFGEPGTRMYRTGDLVRVLTSGELEYVGRTDFQVKLRGLRIELGEIEDALDSQPNITGSVARVVSNSTNPSGDFLAAYVTVDGSVDDTALTTSLRRTLPAYMVPVVFVTLDRFPLNANGKLDRSALPTPDPVATTTEFRAPETPSQRAIAEAFAHVLGLERVGLDDNFFDTGGNSLSATRVIGRANAELGIRIDVRAIFDSPTVYRLAEIADAEIAVGNTGRPTLTTYPRPEHIPLSLAQTRMWFLNQFEPDSAVNNIPVVIRLTGSLDVIALSAAVSDVVARHETLRTTYPSIDGVGYQRVADVGDSVPSVAVIDTEPADVGARIREVVLGGFDVTAQVPLRIEILRVTSDEFVLVLVVHHIAADGFSMVPLTRDVMVAYEARARGAEPAWTPLPVQYADYTLWQRDVLGSEDDLGSLVHSQVQYWATALAGLPDQLDLPVDRRRPAEQSGRGGVFFAELDERIAERIDAVSRAHDTTPFMLVHAALALALAKLSGTDDIAIGTPVAGRGEAALDDVVGMFVNTLVLRTEVEPNIAFLDFLAGVRESDLTAFGHADVPFERLVEVLDPARSAARHPLFQVMLTFENIGGSAFELPGLEVAAVDIDTVTAKFDLQFTIAHNSRTESSPESVSAALTYAADLFDESTVAGFWNRFVRVLDAVTAAPTVVVGDVEILESDEYHDVTTAFNDTAHVVPNETLVSLLRGRRESTPDAAAVVFEDQALDYRQFGARVTRLARHLIARGVGPETLVALSIRRSVEMLVAIHAVVEAGGAYVPIDPDQPVDRVENILETANPALILVSGDTHRAFDGVGDRVIDVRALDLADYSDEPITDAERTAPLDASNTAYVIFTSGSTGRPKGVAVSHTAIVNRLLWMQASYGLDHQDTVLQKTPVTFDVSVWELFWPLIAGARLVVAKPEGHRDPAYLVDVVAAYSVTTIHFVPSLLAVFADGDTVASAASLTRIFASGEALPPSVASRVRTALPEARIHNLYGPTEAAVDVTFHEVTSADVDDVLIGSPVWNTRAYVLDSRLRPVPVGVAGELYLAGDQLARGYVARPDLTADRFVADPYSQTGGRLYRTGDLAVWTASGELSYRGRTDFQVKLRGLRIELGEIESALSVADSVAQAVVVLREAASTGDMLVAYLVARAGATVDIDAVRSAAAIRLPEYMVPAAFVVLAEFPLGPSGKLDRRALPAPELGSDAPFREAESETERIIAQVFADLLGRDRIGVDDSFFALGGDSIVSIQLVARAKARGVVFSPRDVFEHKTIAGLADVARTDVDVPVVLDELEGGGTGWMPLTPFAQRLVTQGGGYSRFTQNLTLELPETIEFDSLVTTLSAVVDRHDALRSRLTEDERGPGLEVSPPGETDVASLVDHVEVERSGDLAELASRHLDAALSELNPSNGVVIRFVWFDFGPSRTGRLLIVAHHLVVDGVSWRIIVPDLMTAWLQVSSGESPALAEVVTSLRRWSHGLSDDARSAARRTELPSWKAIASVPDPEFGDRPFDPKRDTESTVERFDVSVPTDITADILTTVPAVFRGGVNDGLLAALALAVAEWRRRRGVSARTALVQLEGHGREEDVLPGADLSRTVGWFTSVYPVALDVGSVDLAAAFAGTSEAGRAVKAVKEQLLAVPSRGMGYGILRYLDSGEGAELATLPSGQISFNYLGRVGAGDIPEGFDSIGWLPAQDLGALEPIGDADMPANKTIDINAIVTDAADGPRLGATVAFASDLIREKDVRELSALWVDALGAIAAHASSGIAGGLTPSDVPLVDVDQSLLDTFEATYSSSPVVDVWPLAPLQTGLLFHAQLAEASVDVYTMQIVLDLAGEIDDERLRGAAQAVVDRYENLRVAFGGTSTGSPVQLVLRNVEVPWQVIDLRSLPEDARESAAAEFAAKDQARQFELLSAPLLRFALVRTGEDRARLVFTNHHLLLDGWSLPLLMKDLLFLYAVRGDDSLLPRVRSYRNYLSWLAGRDRQQSLAAWTSALSGCGDPTLVAPGASARTIDTRSGAVSLDVDEELTRELAGVGAKLGVTVNTMVQSAWGILLAQLTSRDDVVFGATVSGRPADLVGVESMVGLFINTVPVRIAIAEGDTLESLLSRVQREQADLLDHHQLGLTDILAAAGRTELFDTLTVFESYPVDEAGLAEQAASIDGMSVTGISSDDNTHYPLTLLVVADSRIRFTLKYFHDLFTEDDVRALLERLVVVLRSISGGLQNPVDEVSTLLPGERRKLLGEWNETGVAVDESDSLLTLFQSHVVSAPDATAVVFEDNSLTYAELDARANRLARVLIEAGAGPETLVAVALPRSENLVVALVAVVKSGAGYLPVDAAYPAERIRFTLDDARPVVVLTDDAGADVVRTESAVTVLFDSVEDSIPSTPITDADRTGSLRSSNTAYVIYTSGSTGRPKGVSVAHRNVLQLFANAEPKFGFGADDVWTMFHSYAFDFSVWELWGPLLYGGRLVVVDYLTSRSPEAFRALVEHEGVTVLNQTPSAFYQFDEADRAAGGAGLALRYVVFGGEALDLRRLAGWYERHADSPTLVNMYGITETTVHVSFHELDASMAIEGAASAIGRGLPGLSVYVLDGRMNPVPVGMAGEVYVAGDQLSRGYLGRRDLTVSRFVADPFGVAGGRLYRTGDVARWNSAGVLEYAGRSDSQVQLRGFRIELGEVESALLRFDGVASAVALVRSTPDLGERLVGYVVPRSDAGIDTSALSAFVAEFLTGYMVPDAIVVLESLPLTVNGKLDRGALPNPVFGVKEFRAPSSPVEELVAGVFAEVLGVPRVGLDDDFFDLGGNSLIATRLVSRVGAALNTKVGVRDLFEAPNVAALAARVEADENADGLVPLVAGTRPERIPLSVAQQRFWFLNQFDTTSAVDNIPLVVRLIGDLDVDALRVAISDVLARHESLRTRYPAFDGVPYQEIMTVHDALPRIDVVDVAPGDVQTGIGTFLMRGFDVAASVPLAGRIFRVESEDDEAPGDVVLAFVVHHISADGASMGPLARDVMIAYEARIKGRTPQWRPLDVQYADFAMWQRTVLGDENDPTSVASRQVGYWREALAGLPEQLDLPSDRARPAQQSFRGRTVRFVIDAELHRDLVTLSRTHQSTLFMTVHAALAVLLARLSGTRDIAVGTPIAGRGERELDDLIGMFVNTLVLRSEVDPAVSFAELLRSTRDRDLSAFAHADVPFERLVEVLNPARSMGRNPLFQVGLTFQNLTRSEFELAGLSVGAVDFEMSLAKTDLQLTVHDRYFDDGTPADIDAEFTYATDLFDASTVAGFAERFIRVLESIVADASVVVGDIALLGDGEVEELVRGRNATTVPVTEALLLDGFDAQVRATPEAVAVTYEGTSLTYAQFDARVNGLARHLIEFGVAPESLVGLAIRRSIDLVVGMYAIVRAGGAYVPLDPDHPAERIAHIVETASPVCIVTTASDRVEYGADVPVVDLAVLDLSGIPSAPVAAEELRGVVHPETPAYVIFTSGSTGRPKGVAVSHEAIVNQSVWMAQFYGLGAGDVYLQKTATTFDVSLWGYFLPLRSGGRLVVATPDGHRDPVYVAETIAAESVTVTDFVPSMLTVFAAYAETASLRSLRHVFVIGEALPPETVAGFARVSTAHLHNLYGPTEAAVSVTYWEAPTDGTVASVPIGVPESNVRVYVLDGRLHPVPVGVAGELYLAGPQLARGYVSRPDLTFDRFVADPLSSAPGARMYRTGDLVFWNADGQLGYVGRTDFQVKFRGQRIELGEIETALLAVTSVSQAAAVVVSTVTGEQLAAYVVAAPDTAVDVEAVRAAVGESVPSYMVPSAIVVLDAFPLNTSGKLDRKALPSPVFEVREFRAPHTPVQEIVAGVFAEVLGVERVGLDDDFFGLGGNSLIATQVVFRVAKETGVEVRLPWLFTAPTVVELSERIEAGSAVDSHAALGALLPLRAGGTAGPLFCVHPMDGLAYCYAGLTQYIPHDRPVYGLQTPSILENVLPESIFEIAQRYISTMKSAQPEGPYRLLGWSLGGVIAHAIAVELQEQGEVVADLIIVDSVLETDAELFDAEVRQGLREIGVDIADVGDLGDIDEERAERLLHAFRGDLISLDATKMARIATMAVRSPRLIDEYVPGTFVGDVLYISAEVEHPQFEDGAGAWVPHIDGEVVNRTLPGSHVDLMSGASLQILGPIVAAELKDQSG